MPTLTKPTLEHPSWDALYRLAEGQHGYFTTDQARSTGFSTQLLYHHIKAGRVVRAVRGIYRLVHFPASDHEHLVVIWLWSKTEGVFGHETALLLHELSDALPATIHLNVPLSWQQRRLRTPRGVRLTYAAVPQKDRTWHGAVPITKPARTLRDVAAAEAPPDIVADAYHQGLRRGLFTKAEVPEAVDYLRRFGRLRR